ncbi:MAG: 3-phosphoshikimate 1-carboxyvinyltransferase [Deltaproteobacteria bacterium]|nr:MAG: 3-phosphoshikimate 1-carboxyvinyltransferase [Deltaproteobacteria bacterium]
MTEADPLPERLEIAPRSSIDAQLRPPGSKSITNRALLLAALARGDSRLLGPLDSDDTRVMVQCLVALGVPITMGANGWSVAGRDGRLDRPPTALHTGNSGTTARFLTAACALVDGNVVIDGSERMRQRPISDLVDALEQLGVQVDSLGEGGCPPLRVRGGSLRGGRAVIDGSRSSQYVSGVLMVAPHAQQDVELSFLNGVLVSRPYVELTLQMMRAFGVAADWTSEGGLEVKSGQHYRGREYSIEPDASAAVYPFCAAAITGGLVRVLGLPSDSIQADLALLPILEQMGCDVTRTDRGIAVQGPGGSLEGVDVDMNNLPDAALALAVVAAFARGPTHIRNVGNLRIKETDRLAALEHELCKLGASARTTQDSLTIEPGPLRAAEIETYHDHRMAMSFALAGLRQPGVVIQDPACVTKTWPGYFAMLESL